MSKNRFIQQYFTAVIQLRRCRCSRTVCRRYGTCSCWKLCGTCRHFRESYRRTFSRSKRCACKTDRTKKREQINSMLHTILTFGAILGVLLMCLGMLSARIILELSGTPESVMGQALLYIRIYFISIPFMVIYNFGSAVLRSFGDSRRPMYYLILSGTVNVILNLFLVICFHLGVSGVAIATVISNVLSSALVIIYLYKRPDEFRFQIRNMNHVEMQLSL